MVKAEVKRRKTAWKEILGVRDEVAKERCVEAYKEEKKKVKGCIYQRKRGLELGLYKWTTSEVC